MPLTERAPAKVNLWLRVIGKRADGYHDIESLVAFAGDVGDSLTLRPGRPDGVHVEGPFAAGLTGPDIVAAALEKLRQTEPRIVLGAVTLDKRLPVSSGLGGGSADAAALLRLVQRANPALCASIDWRHIATSLGADVPVCLEGRSALIRGRGERVLPLSIARAPAVLVNALNPMPEHKTAKVFAALTADDTSGRPTATAVPDAGIHDLATLAAAITERGNDLTRAARRVLSGIDETIAAIERSPCCLAAQMSGAGATAFGLFSSPEAARQAAEAVAARHAHWWVHATVLR